MEVGSLKRRQLEEIARHREKLRKSPHLRWLFFELTDRCNLQCRHCGSSCTAAGQYLRPEDVEKALTDIRGEKPMICLTGGEPMLHPDFYAIAKLVREKGFSWGMTTNGTLIDDAAAGRLKEAGMSTVSVSLDGMEEAHDALRRKKGAWMQAVKGIRALLDAGFKPQVTTVLHRENLDDLEPLYRFLDELGIDSWRPINTEPIGRACETDQLLLSPEQFRYLLSYIRSKRFDRSCRMEVTFGCSHYLGTDDERMVRDHYFLCGAGILTASVRVSGDITACLDIENRPELIQGNIREDDLSMVWKTRFQAFRRDRTEGAALCADCPERVICGGDSAHTWDYDRNMPLLCLRTLDEKRCEAETEEIRTDQKESTG